MVCPKMYLCSQGRATNGMVGVVWQMGHIVSSSAELGDLSLENGRRRFLTDDELRRGSSNSNISCHQNKIQASNHSGMKNEALAISFLTNPRHLKRFFPF